MNISESFTFVALFTLLLPLTLTACSTSPNPDESKTTAATKTICTNPRPLICTRDYRPVCAESQSGRYRTYSNGCSACSNPDIVSYDDGACPKGK